MFYVLSFHDSELYDINIVSQSTLEENIPNPFNPSTKIRYSLSQAENVRIEIFNIRGQLVRTLVSGFKDQGNHTVEWNGVDDQGQIVGSGVYFYRLTTDSVSEIRKMLLLK